MIVWLRQYWDASAYRYEVDDVYATEELAWEGVSDDDRATAEVIVDPYEVRTA